MTFTRIHQQIRQRIRRFLGLDKARRGGRGVRRVRPQLEVLEGRLAPAAQTFDVTRTDDPAVITPNTLRWAIQQANLPANSGSTIDFLFGNTIGTVQTITLDPTTQPPLPAIIQPTTINGLTQGGPGATVVPWVNIDGNGMNGDGLTVEAPSVIIEGLAIYKFQNNGIELDNPAGKPGDVIQTNALGVDATGTVKKGNGLYGIGVFGPDDTIGGIASGTGNLISGNTDGIHVQTTGTRILSNLIGTDRSGNATIGFGNRGDGISISTNATANTIGGAIIGGVDPGNIICGNGTAGDTRGGYGILIDGFSSQNEVLGNNIGVGVDGKTKLGNTTDGILIRGGSTENTIGFNQGNSLNVISGNTANGIHLSDEGTTGNLIQGNYLGIASDGKTVVANGTDGVLIDTGASANTIGGTTASQGNVISGNVSAGVATDANTSDANVIQGNYIGTDTTGTVAVPNSTGVLILSEENMIGGFGPGQGNVISGNQTGVSLGGQDNALQNNLIGTDETGKVAVGNATGVSVSGTLNTIGGSLAGQGNVISGNTTGGVSAVGLYLGGSQNEASGNSIGVDITGNATLANSDGVVVAGNQNSISGQRNIIAGNNDDGVNITGTNATVASAYVGVYMDGTKAGNLGMGVHILRGSGNTIGGTTSALRNVISANGVDGILIEGTGSTGNVILGNYIGTNTSGAKADGFGNGRDGINLAVAGASQTTIGGTATGAGNVISGNKENGIEVDSNNNLIAGNYIGIVAGGAAGVVDANGADGVLITGNGNTVGGTTAGSLNVISGNGQNGVEIGGGNNNLISGNYIGVGTDGTTALGNTLDGVCVDGTATANTIGGSVAAARNVISGNSGFGVDFVGAGAAKNTVDYDYIGLALDGITVVANTKGWQGGNIAGNTWGANNKHN